MARIRYNNTTRIITGIYRTSALANNELPSGDRVSAEVTTIPPFAAPHVAKYNADGTFTAIKRGFSVLIAETVLSLEVARGWKVGLGAFGGVTHSRGIKFVESGEQFVKIIYLHATISTENKIKIIRAWREGAADINSPDAFAGAIDQFPSDPVNIVGWVAHVAGGGYAIGDRLPLASATQNHGVLDPNYKSYDRSWLV